MHETRLHQPLLDDKFIYSRYLASEEADVKRGSMRSVCSMIVYASTFVPNGTAYVIDAHVDAVMFIHRDVTVEDWDDPQTGEYGIKASTTYELIDEFCGESSLGELVSELLGKPLYLYIKAYPLRDAVNLTGETHR